LNGVVALWIETERLVLRVLARPDIPEFVRYRNIGEVARYQDWELPYTEAMADELVDEMQALGGITPGEWVQLAIERDGELVGDIAVWVDLHAELGSIGYTVAPEHQGHNYAVEAATAVIDRLFDVVGVHRVTATLDPRNMASARVLERCGFEYSGTARSSALVRGEWTDDTRFSLLAADWEAWRKRPTGPPTSIELVELSADNVREVGAIEVAHSQRRFVGSVHESIADAAHPPVRDGVPIRPWYRAIRADGELVGFAMLALPTSNQPVPILWRMLVGTWHQRRGIARRAIGVIAEMLLAQGHHHLDVSFVDEPGGPEAFYVQLGFRRTGVVDDDGEVWARAGLEDILRRLRRTA
jgi:RimJ/RimL family protein N-acetyltransferase